VAQHIRVTMDGVSRAALRARWFGCSQWRKRMKRLADSLAVCLAVRLAANGGSGIANRLVLCAL
jgi:hypothetical protein